jgi:hypothetical protein
MNERDIFVAALQEEDPARRRAYLGSRMSAKASRTVLKANRAVPRPAEPNRLGKE